MESFFKIAERGSTSVREVVGGLTTFLAMAYFIVVNPMILSDAGIPFQAALTSTCLGAALLTITMGLAANRPIALAPGMGLNAVVAYTLCVGMGIDWRVAMAVVLIEGLAILILVLCGLRRTIMDAIPADLRLAIGIGIGLFITFVGLKGGGVIIDDASTLLALGDFATPVCIVSVISILVAVVLHVLRVPGAHHRRHPVHLFDNRRHRHRLHRVCCNHGRNGPRAGSQAAHVGRQRRVPRHVHARLIGCLHSRARTILARR